MTSVQTFEYAIREGLSNRQAKARVGNRGEPTSYHVSVPRGGSVKGTGKKRGAAKR